MYQINASYKVVTVTKKELNAFQRFFGMPDSESSQREGAVQYTADSINEAITKLQYLVSNVSTVTEMTLKRIS